MSVIQYALPSCWIKYKKAEIFQELTDAKAAVLVLKTIPFQRRWVEELQKIQLKMEVSGTSRIEGADFAANELEVAIKAETAEQLRTRSQKQANAAVRTYKWIATVPDSLPVDEQLICAVHKLIVTDCDDDHCAPGRIRWDDQNVTFGSRAAGGRQGQRRRGRPARAPARRAAEGCAHRVRRQGQAQERARGWRHPRRAARAARRALSSAASARTRSVR